MADITVRGQGECENTGKVNWRGDQTNVPQGGQAYNKSSTIKLVDLGSRKVVGDRVFRYARAAGAITKGDLIKMHSLISGEINVPNATSDTGVVGSKVLNLYSTTALTKDELADGYMFVQSGSTPGNLFTIRGNEAISATSTGNLYLYDEITATFGATNTVTLCRNMYSAVAQYGTDTVPAGVAPISCTTNDYFWLQTWGPAAVKNSVGTGATVIGEIAVGGATGACQQVPGGTGQYVGIGFSMQIATGGEYSLLFVTIAP